MNHHHSITLVDQNLTPKNSCIQERLMKRRKLCAVSDEFIDARFIVGSVAKVERLWSIAKYVMTDNRKGMSP